MFKWTLALFLFLSVGCAGEGDRQGYSVAGSGQALTLTLRLPPVRTASDLADSLRRLRLHIGSPAMGIQVASSPKVGFQRLLVKEVVESGGISRSQLEAVLRRLLTSDDCSGASCAKIFGLKSDEVPSFLDDLRYKVLASDKSEQASLESQREALLSSLTPESEIIMAQKTRAQAGSNAGGFFKGLDGIDRYVKFYNDPAQAYGEHLAAMIYRDLDIPAPKTRLMTYQNGLAFVSEVIPSANPIRMQYSKADAQEILKGFVADVLTANWDVVGMIGDNIVKGADGKFYRIDNGGAFLMRATNGRKPSSLLHQITEWEVFRDLKMNTSYAELILKAGLSGREFSSLAKSRFQEIESLRLRYGGWHAYVAQRLPEFSGEDATTIVAMLEKRSSLLKSKISSLP